MRDCGEAEDETFEFVFQQRHLNPAAESCGKRHFQEI